MNHSNIEYFMKIAYKVNIEMKNIDSNITIYWGEIEELPNCVTSANTLEQLMDNINQIKKLIFQEFIDKNIVIPVPGNTSFRNDLDHNSKLSKVRIPLKVESQ